MEYRPPKNSDEELAPPLYSLFKFYGEFMCVFSTTFFESDIYFSVEIQFYENPSQEFIEDIFAEINAILSENSFENEGNIFKKRSLISPQLLEICYKSFVLELQDEFSFFTETRRISDEILSILFNEFSPVIVKICSLDYPNRDSLEYLFTAENIENELTDFELIEKRYEKFIEENPRTDFPTNTKPRRSLINKVYVFQKRLKYAFTVFRE